MTSLGMNLPLLTETGYISFTGDEGDDYTVPDLRGNVNGDEAVDLLDLLELHENWHRSVESATE